MNIQQMGTLATFYFRNLMLMKIAGRINWRINSSFRANVAKRWENLRKQVEGHDKWLVVGNGPSLKMADLEALTGIPAIASNKINLLFGQTDWRPTLYTIADPLLLHKLPANHYEDFPLVLMPHEHIFMSRADRTKVLPWNHVLDPDGEAKYDHGSERVSPINGLYVGRTITCPNILLAIWAGAKTVYVIGCDHNYKKEEAVAAGARATHVDGSDHFHPDYRKPGELVNAAPIARMDWAYEMTNRVAAKHGVAIINITRQSALKAFTRGTVEDALKDIGA